MNFFTKPKSAQKNRLSLRSKLTFRNLIPATAFLTIATVATIFFFNLSKKETFAAAANNDYETVASGNWNGPAVWEKYNSTTGLWGATATPPNSGHNVITIRNGHTVTITSGITVDQVVINVGGKVILNNGITLTLNNGSGTDLTVSGTFTNAGTVTLSSSSISFLSGGLYQHNFTTGPGTIPTATWSTGSTCEIIGYTSNTTPPSGLQTFYNFSWNCPSQSGIINLGGALTTIDGIFTVASTGSTGELQLASNGSILAIGTDYKQTGGMFKLSTAGSQTSNMTISGDFVMSGGTLSVVTGSSSIGNINIYGDYSHTAGTITEGGSSGANGQFYFKNPGTLSFVSGGSVTQTIDYTVNSGAILSMGTYTIGGRNFTLSSGAGISIGSSVGITSSGATGNVQSSGTRSFSTSADYTYAGSSAQVTGNGLPATVHNFTVNNSSNVTLTSSVIVSNILTFTNGKIITGANLINVTNNSTSSVTGNSNSKYVVGNLQRSVASSGTYSFPLGTTAYSELLKITLSGTSGFSYLTGTFVNTNPVVAGYPLSGLTVNNIGIDKMLDYGYWTLTPNGALAGGTYTVELNEQGFANSNGNSGCTYCVLERANASSSWQSLGTHDDSTQTVSGGIVKAVRSGLNSFYQFGIGYIAILSFDSPSVISGTDGNVNCVYLFSNVCSGVDAWIQIMQLSGGATLSSIDNTGTGYTEAFQPYINLAPNTMSSILWKIVFKKTTTAVDTTLPNVTMSGIDVDGSATVQEFIEATMPNSYTVDPSTILTITNTGGNYRATAPAVDLSGVDTTNHQVMYQLNYTNVNTMFYRTGGVSQSGSVLTRQTSLYFKAFISGTTWALPIELVDFNAKLKENKVQLSWETATETNNDYFTVERSGDGVQFETILRKKGAGNCTHNLFYNDVDENPLDGISYYRLKQTDFDGKYTFSEIKTVKNGAATKLEIKSISPNPFESHFDISFKNNSSGPVDFTIVNSNGLIVDQGKMNPEKGINNFTYNDSGKLKEGIYFIILDSEGEKVVKKIVKY